MRTTFRAAAAALVLTFVAGIAHAQGTASAPIKLGYVNTQALMAAAPGRDAAAAQYDKEAQAFVAQQKKWSDSLSKAYADFQKVEPTLTAAQKTARQEKLQALETELQAENLKGQQKMQQRQSELLAPIMEVVRSAIDDIRTEGGYSFIFSGDENSPIVSADKNLDLTEKVISRLKTMGAKVATPSSMAPAAVTKRPPA